MPSCVVKWCINKSHLHKKNSGISFHVFPQDQYYRELWTKAVRLERQQNEWNPSKKTRICSVHFSIDDFYVTNRGYTKLKTNAIPICTMVFSIEKPVQSTSLETMQWILTPITVNTNELLTVKDNAIEIPNPESSISWKRRLILVALALYACGSYQTLVGQSSSHSLSQPSVSRAILQVTEVLILPQIFNKYVKFPGTQEDREEIKRGFPHEPKLKEKWIEATGNKDWLPTKHSTICSIHFEEASFVEGKKQRILTKAAYPTVDLLKITTDEKEDSSKADNGNETKVFCPKCNVDISRFVEGIQANQTKLVVAKVYHYFEQEYEELKKSFKGVELTPLSKFRQRTALATGVSETTVWEVLQEEARRNAEREEQRRNAEWEEQRRNADREEQSRKERCARKRPRQTDSSSEEDSESNDDGDDEQSSAAHVALADPISTDIKTEPQNEEATLEETLVVKEEPAEESLESCNEEPEIYVQRPEVKDEPGVSGAKDALADPISTDIKTEPQNEEATSSNDAPLVHRATKRYKGRKRKQKTKAPPAATAPPAVSAPPIPNAPPSVSAPPTLNAPPATPRRQLLMLDDGEIKMEFDEGFS